MYIQSSSREKAIKEEQRFSALFCEHQGLEAIGKTPDLKKIEYIKTTGWSKHNTHH